MGKGGIIPWGSRPDENCVYFKGLPVDCTDLDLYELCAPFGAIPPGGVSAMMKDGMCNGIGFVDFSDVASALLCIQGLQGITVPGGEPLFVKQKSPSTWKQGKGKGEK